MTINLNSTPNSVHLTGDTTLHHHFGAIQYVEPRCLGDHPHVDVRFINSVRLELSPATAAILQRELLLALAKLPEIPAIHDAVGEEL